MEMHLTSLRLVCADSDDWGEEFMHSNSARSFWYGGCQSESLTAIKNNKQAPRVSADWAIYTGVLTIALSPLIAA